MEKTRESQYYRTIVQYRNYVQALESHRFLSGKPTKLVIARDVHGTIQAIRIPQKDSKRLLNYLMNGHGRHDDFDCQSFSHKIKGSSMRYPHHNNAKVFFHKRIDRGMIAPEAGDYILLTVSDAGGKSISAPHHAYCMGDGLYISKYGPHKGLYINTLEDMHKHYGTNSYKVLSPNPFHEDNDNVW